MTAWRKMWPTLAASHSKPYSSHPMLSIYSSRIYSQQSKVREEDLPPHFPARRPRLPSIQQVLKLAANLRPGLRQRPAVRIRPREQRRDCVGWPQDGSHYWCGAWDLRTMRSRKVVAQTLLALDEREDCETLVAASSAFASCASGQPPR